MVTGAVASGTIANTDVIDLSYLVLTEVSGTPGAEHIFDFYGAYSISPSIWNLKITGRYQGNPAHVNYFYYWNWSTSAWTRITANANDWPSSGTDATFQMAMPSNEALWISGGHVRILLVHASSGNPTHRYYYDQIVFA